MDKALQDFVERYVETAPKLTAAQSDAANFARRLCRVVNAILVQFRHIFQQSPAKLCPSTEAAEEEALRSMGVWFVTV